MLLQGLSKPDILKKLTHLFTEEELERIEEQLHILLPEADTLDDLHGLIED